MILDAATVPDGTELRADICIVGGGAAGLALADALIKAARHLDIILLEAGGLRFDAAAQAGLVGETAPGSPHPPPHLYRRRGLGGATAIWGGRCVPLDPIDLERRPWVPHSGWPIGWDALAAHYPAAMALCEAGSCEFDAGRALGEGAPPSIAGFVDPDVVATRLERFSRPTDFGRSLRASLAEAPRLRVICGAEALRLEAATGPVTGLQVAGPPGRRFTVRARHYVLATGGLEVPRLLLASDPSRRGGLGNEGGALGRYYMCHAEATLGRLRLLPADRPVALDFETTPDSIYVRRKFDLAAAALRREGLLSTTFRLHYPLIADPAHGIGILSAMYLVKDVILPEYRRKLATIEQAGRDRLQRGPGFWLGHAGNVVRDGMGVARFGQRWLRRRTFASRKLPYVVVRSRDGSYPLDVNAEQIPDPANRVSLGAATDRHGIPQLRVDWRLLPQDRDSLLRSMAVVRDAFARSGTGRLDYEVEALQAIVAAATPVGGHHIGTARMSATPADGVVDANCTVHGVPNLHIAGAAVFPTCGHANPTLTIVALALRLAGHLATLCEAGVATQAKDGATTPRSVAVAAR